MPSDDLAVSVRGLAKSYTIAHNAARQTNLTEALFDALRRRRATTETFWALRDVSFDIRRGDVVGIIGRNGAGKSTLLKVLSRITLPTHGQIDLFGRVGSLLEVGTGFHPELTGRENIFLNGAILGMKRREIARAFDAIVDFSGTGRFLDTPVKRYSSGMYVRLAFAVAAHLNPEILIVDEVLAVGDAEFQKKCLGKMQDVARQGRTILFVSHNLESVRKLCGQGILMEKGRVAMTGPTRDVLDRYIESGAVAQSSFQIAPPTEEDAPGCAVGLQVETQQGTPASEIPAGKPWQARVHFRLTRPISDFVAGLGILTPMDLPLRTTWSAPQALEPGDYVALFQENTIFVEPGRYPLIVGLMAGGKTFHYAEKAGALHVAEVSDFAEEVHLVKLKDCGLLLNQMDVSISRCEEQPEMSGQ